METGSLLENNASCFLFDKFMTLMECVYAK